MVREHEVSKTAGNSADDSSQRIFINRMIKSTRNTVLEELPMHPPKTNRDVKKLKWQYKVRNMPKRGSQQ